MVFSELGGNAVGISMNYERMLTKLPLLAARVGYGKFYQAGATSIPLSLHYLYDIKNQNFAEVGIGYTWVEARTYDPCPGTFKFYPDPNCNKEERNADHKLIATLGYRKHFGWKKRFMLKGIFTAQLKSTYDESIITSAGIGFGYRF
jgi:hypothetical protein